uniref:HNH endonuclease n=1 Tax=Marseillevirus LCMAC102 TaxID=2506603 RepID=A0A481YUC7_9VIRU|nr:MAG: HNH endonuclease [Marseillevirus LCMAC102]
MDLNKTWNRIPEFPDYYVSEDGNIWSKQSHRLLKTQMKCGYENVTLRKNKTNYGKTIHRLVALAFIPNPDNLRVVNHKDGVKTNNHISNLEWVTQKENIIHAHKLGLSISFSRSVCQLDKHKNLVYTFSSIKEASEKTNVRGSHIVDVCKGRRSKEKGWYWCYAEDLESFRAKKIKHGHQKGVYQIDKNTTEVVKIWDSMKEAASGVGVNPATISRACSNSLTVKKYLWKHVPIEKEDLSNINYSEKWVVIPEYPNYAISPSGEIYSKFLKRPMRCQISARGYKSIGLINKDGRSTTNVVHVLVAKAYIPNPDNKPFVNHKNNNKQDAKVENLEWCTHKENMQHSVLNGHHKGCRAINQIKNGQKVATFPSIADASRNTGIPHSSISYFLNKKDKTGNGYIWEYC